jgi:hypothetical protein
MYLHLLNTCFFCFPVHIFNLGLRAGLSPWWISEKKKCFRKRRCEERKIVRKQIFRNLQLRSDARIWLSVSEGLRYTKPHNGGSGN